MSNLYVDYDNVTTLRNRVLNIHAQLQQASRVVRDVEGGDLGVPSLTSAVNDSGEEWEREIGQLAAVSDRAADSLDDVLEYFRSVDEELGHRAPGD